MTLPGHRHSGPFAGISGSRAALVVCAGTLLLGVVLFSFPPASPPPQSPPRATRLSPPPHPSSLPHPHHRVTRIAPSHPQTTPSTPAAAPSPPPQGLPSFAQRQRFLSNAARLIHPSSTLTEITPDSPGASLTLETRKITVSAIASPIHQPDPVLEADISPAPSSPLPLTPRHPSSQGFSPEEALFRSRWGWNTWAAAQRTAFLNLHAGPTP